jgi:formate dehydrogenase maturation protein FdhE
LGIKRKVEKLMEEHREKRRGQRCEFCASWPATRFVSNDELVSKEGKKISLTSELQESCPSCGYQPQPIRIHLIDDWRGGRAAHTKE